MSITRADLIAFRTEYVNDVANRGSCENDVIAIKISVLIANNSGFTVYKSLPTIYEESRLNTIINSLTNLFEDSSVTYYTEEETGKTTIVVDWDVPTVCIYPSDINDINDINDIVELV